MVYDQAFNQIEGVFDQLSTFLGRKLGFNRIDLSRHRGLVIDLSCFLPAVSVFSCFRPDRQVNRVRGRQDNWTFPVKYVLFALLIQFYETLMMLYPGKFCRVNSISF